MITNSSKKPFLSNLKEIFFFLLLFGFIVMVNAAIISKDLMYAEQPLIYLANQSIHSFSDFLNVYLHPKMLDIFSIPFFRPSGHFLMYQLLAPLLGWHNTRGFLMINLFFLTLTGYVTIKLYSLLFPGSKVGGYLAFSIYLMQPALILSRLIVLHFEFAYVFFVMLSLYCFVRFSEECKKFSLLAASLILYLVAISFKEAALMLGPVLAVYFLLSHCQSKTPATFFQTLFNNKKNLEILFIIFMLSLVSALYLTLPWPSLSFTHPLGDKVTLKERLVAVKEFINILFCVPKGVLSQEALYHPQLMWREIVYPPLTCLLTWILWGSLFLWGVCLSVTKRTMAFSTKKALVFLSVTFLLFMVLPVNWAMAFPWHLSLSLLFLSLMMGFAVEAFLKTVFQKEKLTFFIGLCLALGIGLTTISVNESNLTKILEQEGLTFALDRNAILFPPAIKEELNDQSIVVVEDSILHNSYALGSSGYVFLTLGNFDYDAFQRLQNLSYLRYQPLYNGTLFKWAYLLPSLQEEVYPFSVDRMEEVPNEILYNWLQHSDNIFCLGYDKQGKWLNKTVLFKQNIAREKNTRQLVLHQYAAVSAASLNGTVLYTKKLIFPDHQLCQYECDQNTQCKGFTYENAEYQQHSTVKCQFYDHISRDEQRFCATCIGFVKELS